MHSIIQYLESVFFFFLEIPNRSKVITTNKLWINNYAIGPHFDIYGRDPPHSLDILSGFSTIPL